MSRKKISRRELYRIVREHQKWVESNHKKGKRADLSNTILEGADLCQVNLSGANLDNAFLYRAHLELADLSGASLVGTVLEQAAMSMANLSDANLNDARLCGADMSQANLTYANMDNVDARGTNMGAADLKGASLRSAELREAVMDYAGLVNAVLDNARMKHAILRRANLSEASMKGILSFDTNFFNATLDYAQLAGADLSHANLCGASLLSADMANVNLRGANLSDADMASTTGLDTVASDITTMGFHMVPPETGAYDAWKAAGKCLVKLRIPKSAMRSSATTRKCRASKAKVMGIFTVDGKPTSKTRVYSSYDPGFAYEVGKTVTVRDFDTNRWHECAPGIHHFLTMAEAVMWLKRNMS